MLDGFPPSILINPNKGILVVEQLIPKLLRSGYDIGNCIPSIPKFFSAPHILIFFIFCISAMERVGIQLHTAEAQALDAIPRTGEAWSSR